ncbi:hypothetical protein Tco_0136846, partial [Tanacetum coccineum]
MARQCTQPKRPRNATWYKEKAMLAEAQEAGQILDEEQLTFLVDKYGYIKNYKKTVKNGQARTRESKEYKKKPKNQSRSQKSQTR